MKTPKLRFVRQNKFLLILITLFIFMLIPLHADDDVADSAPLYLYYFETDDVLLETDQIQEYEFTAFRGEFVTIVVYGLDGLITPQLTLRDSNGNIVATGRQDVNQSFVKYIQFTASKNDNYIIEVKSVFSEDGGGLARVMLVEGEAISTDLTYLDTVNPLLPGRVFMVAGSNDIDPEVSETDVGLRVGAEVLPVERFTLMKPDIFVSRGSTDFYPPIGERFRPDTSHFWFNENGDKFYFFTVHALPEDLTSATKNVEFKEQTLNLLTFFYYDYLFVVGKGSDPVLFGQATQPCSNVTLDERAECERIDDKIAETFIGVDEEIGEEENVITSVIVVPPEALDCIDETTGLNITISSPVNTSTYLPPWVGSDCGDNIDASSATTGHAGVFESGTNRHFVYYIFGFGGNDIIYGSDTDDVIWPGFGADRIYANDGDDTIVLEYDYYTDTIDGGDGIDTLDFSEMCYVYVDLYSGFYIDWYYYGSGYISNIEDVVGSPCLDEIYGDDKDNTIRGGVGSDYLYGEAGADTLYGEADRDYIYGGDGDDSIDGGDGDDYLNGDIGNDTIDGGDGNDTIYDGLGTDNVQGDAGNDIVYVTGGLSETFDGGIDTDTIYFNFCINNPGNEIDLIAETYTYPTSHSGTVSDFEIVYGTNCNESITDSTDNDIIYGRNGDDTFYIQNGNDFYYGDAGDDTFSFDSASVNFGYDAITGGTGTDTLTYALVDNGTTSFGIDVNFTDSTYVVYDGTTTPLGSGTFSGIEVVVGSQSEDTFYMNNGSHTINGSGSSDTIDFNTITGVDTVLVDLSVTTNSYSIVASGTTTTGNLTSIENVVGSSGRDTITGNVNANILEGRGGNDILNGGGGADTIDGGSGNDNIFGDGGDDVVYVSAGTDTINGGSAINGDTLDFSNINAGSTVGATINLSGGYSAGGGTATGTFSGIETIIATDYDDNITNSDGLGTINVEAGTGYDSIAFSQPLGTSITVTACEPTCSDGSDGGADITTTIGGLSVASSIELVYGSSGNDIITISGDFEYTYASGTLGTSNDTIDDLYISGGSGSDSIIFDTSAQGYFIIDSGDMANISYLGNQGAITFSLDTDTNTYLLVYQTCNGGGMMCVDQTDSNIYITFDNGGTYDPTPLALSIASGSTSEDPMAAQLDASLNIFALALDSSTSDSSENTTTLVNAFPTEETIADEISLASSAFDSLATANLESLNDPEDDTSTTESTSDTITNPSSTGDTKQPDKSQFSDSPSNMTSDSSTDL